MTRFAVLSLLGLLSVHASAQWTIGQEVKTTSGLVKGHAARSNPQVSEYLGIRFGRSTEGANRFMPPKPYISSEKIDASVAVS
jgi:cholinesterase